MNRHLLLSTAAIAAMFAAPAVALAQTAPSAGVPDAAANPATASKADTAQSAVTPSAPDADSPTLSPSATPPAPAAGGPAQAYTTDEVVVTARRRSENAQRVPVAVTAFSSEKLTEKSITSISQLTQSTPGLTYGTAGGSSNPQIVIRSQSRANQGDAAQPVLTYFSDVPLPPYGSVLPTFDLASIQVLKGPQGTLFGRNSTSGAVLVYPTAPTYDFGGYLKAGYGNLNRKEFEGAVTIPIWKDKVALRLAGQRIKRDPYTKNESGYKDLDDINDYAFRASLLIQPIEALKNVTVYDYSFQDRNGDGAVLHHVYDGNIPERYPGLNYFFDCNTSPACDIDLALAQQQALGKRATMSDIQSKEKNLVYGIANTTTYDLGPITLKNIFGYRFVHTDSVADIDGSALPLVVAINDLQFKQYSEEFQVQGKWFDDRLETIAGAFYLKSEPGGRSGLTLASFVPPTRPSVIQSYRTQTSKALFLAGTYDLRDFVKGLKLNVGGRHTWDETKACADGYAATYPTGPSPLASEDDCKNGGSVVVNGLSTDVLGTESHSKSSAWTWNAGLDYQLTRDVFLYGTVRRGYRAGGVNTPLFSATAPNSLSSLQDYGPETVVDEEIGLKSTWHKNGWSGRFNVDVFHGIYKNTQRGVGGLTSFDGDGNTSNDPSAGTIIINAGKARVQGFDIDAMVSPIPPLSFSAFLTYNDAKYLSLDTPAILSSSTYFPANPGDTAFPFAPALTMGGTARWEQHLDGNLGSLIFNLDVYRASRTYFSAFKDDKSLSQPKYVLVNGRLDWTDINNTKVTLSGYVRNVFNKTVIAGGANSVQAAGFNSVYYQEPRTYGIELSYKF